MSYHLYRARDLCAYVRERAAKATTLDDLEAIERVVSHSLALESEPTRSMIQHYTDKAVRGRLDEALDRIVAAETAVST